MNESKMPKKPLLYRKNAGVPLAALRVLNLLLLCGACAFGVYSVYMAQQTKVRLGRDSGIDVSIPVRSNKRIRPTIQNVQPLSAYIASLKQRDLFEAPWERQQVTVPEEVPHRIPATRTLLDFTQSVRLVGIISDNDPRAVVEDLTNRETIFIRVGDQFKGATLDQILDDKVIFKVDSERIELYP